MMSSCRRSARGTPRWVIALGLLLVALRAGLAYADDPDKAAAKPDQAGHDFALQGEFLGPVAAERSPLPPVGLQVRSIGDEKFEAIQYVGGLPGRRSSGKPPVKLTGRRHEDFLVLSGGPWAMLVHSDRCLVLDREGRHLGRLDRVERQSPTLGAPPPEHAIVLFDGSETEQFQNARITEDGLLMQGAVIKPMFQDFNLHLEFKLPYNPGSRGQGRGNSGVYLMSRYEVQILDSFALEAQKNDCGALYRFRRPDVNMCLPPVAWQTYDIRFTAPRWAADGTKLQNARITVWHNGVKVHDHVDLADKTGSGKPEAPTLLPIRLQDHGNPVRFRNMWIIDRGAAPPTEFPVFTRQR